MTLTKIISVNNYSKIYFYYDCNSPKQDLQNNILQVYITVIFSFLSHTVKAP